MVLRTNWRAAAKFYYIECTVVNFPFAFVPALIHSCHSTDGRSFIVLLNCNIHRSALLLLFYSRAFIRIFTCILILCRCFLAFLSFRVINEYVFRSQNPTVDTSIKSNFFALTIDIAAQSLHGVWLSIAPVSAAQQCFSKLIDRLLRYRSTVTETGDRPIAQRDRLITIISYTWPWTWTWTLDMYH